MKSNIFHGPSLKRTITLYMLAIFLMGLLAMGLYSGRILREDLQTLSQEQQSSTASAIAMAINNQLGNRLTALQLVAAQIEPAILNNNVMAQIMLERRFAFFQSLFNSGGFVTRLDGTAIASVPSSLGRVGSNFMSKDFIFDAIKQGKSTISRTVIGQERHATVVSMAVPIRDSQGKVLGALAGIIDLRIRNFLNEIAENSYGRTGGYVVIASRDRLIVTASQRQHVFEEIPVNGTNPEFDRFIEGQENPAIFSNSRGVQVLAVSAAIPVADWIVAVVMPVEETFAPMRNLLQRMMFATIVLTLMAGWVIWVILKRQLSPLQTAEKSLESMAETGQVRPLIVLSKDEIGDLFMRFNRLIKMLDQRDQQLKIKNAEINTAKKKAEESDRIKSAFLYNMGHEIRTPMNSIVGFSQLMNTAGLPENERNEYANIINGSCSRLLKTMNNILDITRIDTGQTEIKRKEFHVRKLLEKLHLAHANAFMQKNIEFKIEANPSLDSLVAVSDEEKIYHILNGLLDNAFRFTEKGHVTFGFDLINKHLVFFVQDTGIGIAKSKQGFIFSKLYGKAVPTSADDEGSGLDLVLAKSLVTLLGGNIWLESEEGAGSLFKFTVPFISPASTVDATAQTVAEEMPMNLDWAQKTILIAEDDLNNYLLLKTILSSRTKVKILYANNGEEALKYFKNNPEIELILMDLRMPIMDGFTATRKIRELNKKIPIFALTAYSQPEDREKALEAGCNEFISKPIEIESLLQKLAKTFT